MTDFSDALDRYIMWQRAYDLCIISRSELYQKYNSIRSELGLRPLRKHLFIAAYPHEWSIHRIEDDGHYGSR